MLNSVIARLVRIELYPIKSMDGVSVNEVSVTGTGGLELDRRWRLVRADTDTVVNAKVEPKLQEIRLIWNTDGHYSEMLAVEVEGAGEGHGVQFPVAELPRRVAELVSQRLGYAVRVEEQAYGGFPDDLDAPGPTLVSTPTLRLVADHFGISLSDARARFRTNLEVDGPGMPPFWEDLLVPEDGVGIDFAIGDVTFAGVNPCQRCVVPTRDPKTGVVRRGFQKEFSELRKKMLPEWAPRSRFNHFFRLAVNTRLGDRPSGSRVRVGDEVVKQS